MFDKFTTQELRQISEALDVAPLAKYLRLRREVLRDRLEAGSDDARGPAQEIKKMLTLAEEIRGHLRKIEKTEKMP